MESNSTTIGPSGLYGALVNLPVAGIGTSLAESSAAVARSSPTGRRTFECKRFRREHLNVLQVCRRTATWQQESQTCLFNPSVSTPKRQRLGFTLVELLVVIGIIALLISILLPALGKARKSAATAVCLSNLHQLNLSLSLYQLDNHGLNPPDYNSGGIWMATLAKYEQHFINPYDPGASNASAFPIPPISFGQQVRSVQYMPKVFFCPEAPSMNAVPAASNLNAAANGGSWGGTTIPWGPGTYSNMYYLSGSYGFNGWLYNVMDSDLLGTIPAPVALSNIMTYGVTDANDFFFNPHYSAQAANAPTFFDSSWVDSWPVNFIFNGGSPTIDSPPATSQQVIAGGQFNANFMGRVCMARHGRAVNVAFLDGHCATVGLADLWKLQWSPLSARNPCPGRIP